MSLVGSELTALGSVLTAEGAPPAGIQTITSTGGSVAITNPSGPITNLEVTGGGLFPGYGPAPPATAATSSAGAAGTASRSDHTHASALESGSYAPPAATQSTGLLFQTFAAGTATLSIVALPTTFPGFGAAPPAIGPSTAGTAATASRSDHSHAWQTVTTIAALAALDASAQTPGQVVYMNGAGIFDNYELRRPSALTVDNITVVAASGLANAQWVRLLQPTAANAFVASWSVDPRGNDENAGTTDATAVKTIQEINRRLNGLVVQQSVTIRVLANLPGTDTGAWSFGCKANVLVTILGVLGANTGPAGVNDNTIYSGTATTFTTGSNAPGASQLTIADTTLPVSATASGLLAKGVICKRTSAGTNRNWFVVKDNGSKTMRITVPINSAAQPLNTANLATGDTYSAYALATIPGQTFGVAAKFVRYDLLYDSAPVNDPVGGTYDRFRAWLNPNGGVCVGVQQTNVMIDATSTGFLTGAAANDIGFTAFINGGAVGTSTLTFSGTSEWSSPVIQGTKILIDQGSILTPGGGWCHNDVTTGDCITVQHGRFDFEMSTFGSGFAGSGNTGKLLALGIGDALATCSFLTAAPPFAAASSSDASPITIRGTSYAVASLPTVNETSYSSPTFFAFVGTPQLKNIAGSPLLAGTTDAQAFNLATASSTRLGLGATGIANFQNVPFLGFSSAGALAGGASTVQEYGQQPPAVTSAIGAHLDAYLYDAVTVVLSGGAATGPLALFRVKGPTYNHTGAATVSVAATMELDPPVKAGGGAWTMSAALYINDPNATGNANAIINGIVYTPTIVGASGLGAQPLFIAVAGGNTMNFASGVALDGSGGNVEGSLNSGIWSLGRTAALAINTTGDLQLGTTGLAAAATAGFPYMPQIVARPTGAPNAFAGASAFALDLTTGGGHALWVRNPVGSQWEPIPTFITSTAAGAGLALVNNAPGAIVSLSAKWWTFKDAAGTTTYIPFFQ